MSNAPEWMRDEEVAAYEYALSEVDRLLIEQAELCLAEGSTERHDRYHMAAAFLRMKFEQP